VRADTTVICANVACPTDAGLLAKAVGKLVRAARRVQAAGGATGTVLTDRRRAAARRVRQIAGTLRTRGKLSREEATRAIRRVTGELAGLAEQAAAQATAVVRNGRRAVPKAISGRVRGRLVRALDELAVTLGRTDDGIILDYAVEYGAAADGPQLAPAVDRIRRRAGRLPRAVTAGRGYGQPATGRDLHARGVRTVAIPRQARASPARNAVEHSRSFHRLVKWRTGGEGPISYLKRCYGWDRTCLDGRNGAAIWCGHKVFAHNLDKIAALAS
jgi:IS5 family transposase